MRRISATWALALLVMILGTTGAWAQEYPVQRGDLNPSASTTDPGDPVSIRGGGFAPGAEVVITLESEVVTLATVSADATGAIDVSVRIPADAPPGSHTLKATGEAAGGGTLVLSAPITVGADVDGPLAFSGAGSTLLLVVTGLGLAVVGIGLLFTGLAYRRVRR